MSRSRIAIGKRGIVFAIIAAIMIFSAFIVWECRIENEALKQTIASGLMVLLIPMYFCLREAYDSDMCRKKCG